MRQRPHPSLRQSASPRTRLRRVRPRPHPRLDLAGLALVLSLRCARRCPHPHLRRPTSPHSQLWCTRTRPRLNPAGLALVLSPWHVRLRPRPCHQWPTSRVILGSGTRGLALSSISSGWPHPRPRLASARGDALVLISGARGSTIALVSTSTGLCLPDLDIVSTCAFVFGLDLFVSGLAHQVRRAKPLPSCRVKLEHSTLT